MNESNECREAIKKYQTKEEKNYSRHKKHSVCTVLFKISIFHLCGFFSAFFSDRSDDRVESREKKTFLFLLMFEQDRDDCCNLCVPARKRSFFFVLRLCAKVCLFKLRLNVSVSLFRILSNMKQLRDVELIKSSEQNVDEQEEEEEHRLTPTIVAFIFALVAGEFICSTRM